MTLSTFTPVYILTHARRLSTGYFGLVHILKTCGYSGSVTGWLRVCLSCVTDWRPVQHVGFSPSGSWASLLPNRIISCLLLTTVLEAQQVLYVFCLLK